MVVLALVALVALHGLGGSPPHKARGTTAASAGTGVGVIKSAKVAALAASARTVLDQATALALETGSGPGAVDPSSGSTFLEVAAGDVRGNSTTLTLHAVGGDRYEMSSQGAFVCITAPVTVTGAGSVARGRC